ncbi:hypothetical protein PIB30_104241, partial [Stylosanthes scabra]|nr:hypothetical protein [Stylosanthes scabra]
INAQDIKIWKVIENGNHIPMKETETKVGEVITKSSTPKLESEYNDEDLKKLSLNFKAINFLHCAQIAKPRRRYGTSLKSHMKEQLM